MPLALSPPGVLARRLFSLVVQCCWTASSRYAIGVGYTITTTDDDSAAAEEEEARTGTCQPSGTVVGRSSHPCLPDIGMPLVRCNTPRCETTYLLELLTPPEQTLTTLFISFF